MILDPSTETCPTCHAGTLVREESRADGSTRYFSCGHAHHAVGVSDSLSFSDYISVEHRLGPHSTEAIAYHRGVGGDAVVVSMQQEMYKDALYFLRDARRNHAVDGDPFSTWRSIRAAILFGFAAIESCINQFIDAYLDEHKGALSQREIDRWTEKERFVSINEKLKEGVQLFGGRGLNNDTALWQKYEDLKNLRDNLVHFRSTDRFFYKTDELLRRTERGLSTAGAVIKRIYLAHPANSACPSTFDELP